jgi:hypothetical protein
VGCMAHNLSPAPKSVKSSRLTNPIHVSSSSRVLRLQARARRRHTGKEAVYGREGPGARVVGDGR